MRSDDALVARARDGDPLAFEVLFERHVPGVLSFCRHMLGCQEEGEDAVQQAFVSAHRQLVTGEGDAELRFKPWIYTVARNRCLSMLRARKPETVQLTERADTAGLTETVAARDDLRLLLGDLRRLSDEQRAALVLTELGDLSHAEVATVLGCEESAVKGIVFRARASLTERRAARDADCTEIRAQLAVVKGGALRRGLLRHHLHDCEGCSAYLEEVRRQRAQLALILPVGPTLALKQGVIGGIGGGTTVGAGLATGLGPLAAKVATVVVVAGGTGVAAEQALVEGPPAADGGFAPSAPRSAVPAALPGLAEFTGAAGVTGREHPAAGRGGGEAGAPGEGAADGVGVGQTEPRSGPVGLGEGNGKPLDSGKPESAPKEGGDKGDKLQGPSESAPGQPGTGPSEPELPAQSQQQGPKPPTEKPAQAGNAPATPPLAPQAEQRIPSQPDQTPE
jgi:RNA polymerase sigma factor (sigma-70 family)